MQAKGRCLCGQATYAIDGDMLWAGSCYCRDCQRESGGGHLTAIAVPGAAIEANGTLKTYTAPGGSGTDIDRTFCSECGSTLFSHPHVMGDTRIVRAGTLEDSSSVQPGMAVFCSQSVAWDPPHEDVPTFAEMPPIQ